MPTDLRFPFEFDDTGDASSVDGEGFYYQHALLLGLIASYEVRGGPLTSTDILQFEDRLGNIFANSPYFETPIRVNVTSITDEDLDVEVTASNVGQFEITV